MLDIKISKIISLLLKYLSKIPTPFGGYYKLVGDCSKQWYVIDVILTQLQCVHCNKKKKILRDHKMELIWVTQRTSPALLPSKQYYEDEKSPVENCRQNGMTSM